MSTLVGLELWTDQIGPQTTEQVDGMEGAVGFDAIEWAGGRALLVCSMIHPSASLDAITTEIPLPTRPKTLIATDIGGDRDGRARRLWRWIQPPSS